MARRQRAIGGWRGPPHRPGEGPAEPAATMCGAARCGAPNDNMHIAILTFEGFNELDSLIALGILNRLKGPDWRVSIASPAARVRSMNGVVLEAQCSLAEAAGADAVIVGSGMQTREVVADAALMAQLRLDPSRQLLAA